MGISKMMSILRDFSCILVLVTVGFPCVRGDFAQDKKECQDQLVILTPCLGFISGEEKHPSSTCCLKLIQNFNRSRKCLCILVRDRNEPNLGFKVNATLALTLPFLCHISANETQCLDYLKLDPQSPEAQIFKQFANSTASGTRTSTAGDEASCSTSMREKKRPRFRMVGAISLCLVSSFFSRFSL